MLTRNLPAHTNCNPTACALTTLTGRLETYLRIRIATLSAHFGIAHIYLSSKLTCAYELQLLISHRYLQSKKLETYLRIRIATSFGSISFSTISLETYLRIRIATSAGYLCSIGTLANSKLTCAYELQPSQSEC